LWTLVALAAGVSLFVLAVPPAPVPIDVSAWGELAARTVAGAYHVHTTRSDGIGDRNAVAAAAARAGLAFVILTDHGDATRPPDPPVYLSGVLILDGVEISTDAGHYVAIDMRAAPYPLGGAGDAVVEDVARLGGFGIAAHPDSPKAALRWTDERAPIDGIEWLNADSEWRGEPRARMVRAGIGYLLRPGPAVVSLFDRPVTLARWDRMTKTRPVVGLAGADAHGGVGRRAEDSTRSLTGVIGIPSYRASFGAFSNRVVLDRPLSGDAAADARALLGAIRKGSVFTAIDGLAGPAVLDFHVEAGLERREMGGVMAGDSDGTIVARAALPPGAELILLRDGEEIARGRDEIRRAVTDARGAYRVEARIPGAPGTPAVPWLVSNPVYFGGPAPAPEAAEPPPSVVGAKGAAIAPFPWRIEKDATSSGMLRSGASEAALEYKLGGGPRNSQFVALATDVHGQAFKELDLSLAGDRPMRVSVQVRRASGERWGRSFYVDPAGSAVRVLLARLTPITAAAGSVVSGTDVTSILLVCDLTNAAPGRSGILRVISSALLN
jgi:hypothetical protein